VFGRTKETAVAAPPRLEKVGGKNRPTPPRSAREAANRRPLVPTDRKGATKASRTTSRDDRLRARNGMLNGEERYLTARDRGPVKRFVRDVVDARHSAGEWFLVFVLVLLVVQLLVPDIRVQSVTMGLLWAGVLVVVLDSFRLSRRLREAITERFGAPALEKGVVRYGVMRSLQLRRGRVPRPGIARGASPR